MALRKSHKGETDMIEVNNAVKTLLANIRFMHVDDPIKTIVLTSSIPNEGKSFIAEKLTEAIATSGKTALLMECDLRHRTLANQLGVHARHGLYSVLAGSVSASEAIVSTHVPNMFFLDAEPNIPNPSDLFNSKRFITFLTSLTNAYDYVVVDTPPVGAFVDAAVLSHLADATILVVRENFAKRDQIRTAYEQLQKAGGNITGVVMNYCKHQSSEYGYSYYYKEKDGGSAPSYEASAPAVPAPQQARVSAASHSHRPPVTQSRQSKVGFKPITSELGNNPYYGSRH